MILYFAGGTEGRIVVYLLLEGNRAGIVVQSLQKMSVMINTKKPVEVTLRHSSWCRVYLGKWAPHCYKLDVEWVTELDMFDLNSL